MKFFRNIMLVLLALISVSCSIDKYDIEYTAIAPMGGQYRIISLTDETGAELKTSISSSYRCVWLSNTVLDEFDKCWVRIGSYSTAGSNFYAINGKINCNVTDRQNMTFIVDGFYLINWVAAAQVATFFYNFAYNFFV